MDYTTSSFGQNYCPELLARLRQGRHTAGTAQLRLPEPNSSPNECTHLSLSELRGRWSRMIDITRSLDLAIWEAYPAMTVGSLPHGESFCWITKAAVSRDYADTRVRSFLFGNGLDYSRLL
jgi:hypothetical protein